jgi:3-oxoacyl-[acyl-carrier protein] reductase
VTERLRAGSFSGKRVVITGAAGVHGSELSEAFAREGATLFLSDRREAELKSAADRLGDRGADVFTHVTELQDGESIADLIGAVATAWRSPDTVVNNAGIYPFGDLLDIDAAHWDAILDTNLRAPFLLLQGFSRLMIAERRPGTFVNISSGAADILRLNDVPYCVSKRALEWLSRGFAMRLAQSGIRVNCVQAGLALGSALTEMPSEHVEAIARQNPMGRNSEPGDLAAAVMFLASDAAKYITGEVIGANGGGSVPCRLGMGAAVPAATPTGGPR